VLGLVLNTTTDMGPVRIDVAQSRPQPLTFVGQSLDVVSPLPIGLCQPLDLGTQFVALDYQSFCDFL
jgi:hypothetical protein